MNLQERGWESVNWFVLLTTEHMAGPYEGRNELFSSIQYDKFPEWKSNYHIIKKTFPAWL
jgi:hypothetical protein